MLNASFGGTIESSMYTTEREESDNKDDLVNKVEEVRKLNCSYIAEIAREKYSRQVMAQKYMNEYDKDSRKNKVLLIDVNCNYSSTGKIVYDIYKSLLLNGRKAAIGYGRGPNIAEEGIYKFGLDWETSIHAVLARITGYNGFFSPLSTKRIINFIEEFQPDIIHIHELHSYFVNIKPLIIYIKEKRIPVIWTFHCEYMYTGKCGHAYGCLNFTQECGNCPSLKEYPKSLFFDKTRKMLQMKKDLLQDWEFTIVTPSQWLANRVRMSFLRDKEIKVIHNGIDTDIFKPTETTELRQELGIPEKCKIVLAVAPDIMSEQKGGKWVINLAEIINNNKVYYLLVGGHITCKYSENIMLISKIKNPYHLAAYYSMADIFVLFSKRETYSLTCAEALCCGTPVIGFKCGAPETVFSRQEAIFVDYGDIETVKQLVRIYLHI